MGVYRLKSPIPAILNKPGDEHVSVTLPAGIIVRTIDRSSTTMVGKVGLTWQGRHYSVDPQELVQKAERVSDRAAGKSI